MRKKILITPRSFGKTSNVPFEMLKKYDYEIIRNESGKPYEESELINIIKDIDGIIVGLDKITSNVLKNAKKLKVITKYGVGMDNIDIEEAEKLGIKITFTPGANKESVADLAFSLMLCLSRNVIKLDNIVRSNKWEKIVGYEVYGKTLGIVGTGSIGKGVAKRATGFDMKILAYDKYPDYDFADKIGMKYVDKKTLLEESDFITLHIPLSDETYHFIDEEEFNIMKNTAYIINTSRGGIINENALYNALKDKKIAGAALDAFEEEPPLNSKLFELDNVILSPHCGASTKEATDRMGIMAVEGLISVLEGMEPKYLYKK
ncbi:D-3-phosphoglycerate dehydrogenase [Thermoanaerobacter thermohydrosulfuricus]|uniref:Phosphoglycerate dehydrogenase-like protein n=2 Tax=Thermoanaerobacter thermohydrosulfuricus TaxID=1516 RepID=M8DMW5_THETY|nr:MULTISPECIES: phosphoglycerate dehydrogenase [Thermoanaerobacter]EMT37916.1 Phosphoglycerate dehydrogenase-like protein [Thermoanaerobacter thermohydrosulfuricus WC1]SDF21837.1 D-3-phosphoglycerate dehydrogenase [Thermoanaerobacter thermohydrosulfuricus]SFE63182.1 D-3-phosphoglycerate dehydrogenase [Thermoanaerobacter thermohydrosulfuricus]